VSRQKSHQRLQGARSEKHAIIVLTHGLFLLEDNDAYRTDDGRADVKSDMIDKSLKNGTIGMPMGIPSDVTGAHFDNH
jgi:hypothetical protein